MSSQVNAYDVLKERGFVEQVSDEQGLCEAMEKPIRGYIGYDPSAASFHVGNLLTIMAWRTCSGMAIGPSSSWAAGTGMVGDPSGKTEMRQLLTLEKIQSNAGVAQEAVQPLHRVRRGPSH